MTRKSVVRALLLLGLLINVGVWLMGTYGLEVNVGSHVFGRRIGIDQEETWSSLIGWVITIASTIAMVLLLYRNRTT